jgi:hypothetical protein
MFFAMKADENSTNKSIIIEVNDEIKKVKEFDAEEDNETMDDEHNAKSTRKWLPVEFLYKTYAID